MLSSRSVVVLVSVTRVSGTPSKVMTTFESGACQQHIGRREAGALEHHVSSSAGAVGVAPVPKSAKGIDCEIVAWRIVKDLLPPLPLGLAMIPPDVFLFEIRCDQPLSMMDAHERLPEAHWPWPKSDASDFLRESTR